MGKNAERRNRLSAYRARVISQRLNEFTGLLNNAVAIDHAPADVPPYYIMEILINHAWIGIYNDMWLMLSAAGKPDLYGRSDRYMLTGADGKTFTIPRDSIKIIRTASGKPLRDYLALQAEKLADIDVAIKRNLAASASAILAETETPEEAETLRRAYDEIEEGCPVVYTRKGAADSMILHNAGTAYICDRLQMLSRRITGETLSRIGIVSADAVEKQAQVQTLELPVNYAVDNIYTIIDAFNLCCRDQDVRGADGEIVQMRLNGAIEELYNDKTGGENDP